MRHDSLLVNSTNSPVAQRLGRIVWSLGMIKHVHEEHDFEDAYFFYEFVQGDRGPEAGSVEDAILANAAAQAKDGVVDIVWTVLGYNPGRFLRSEAFELPFVLRGNAEHQDQQRRHQRAAADSGHADENSNQQSGDGVQSVEVGEKTHIPAYPSEGAQQARHGGPVSNDSTSRIYCLSHIISIDKVDILSAEIA